MPANDDRGRFFCCLARAALFMALGPQKKRRWTFSRSGLNFLLQCLQVTCSGKQGSGR